MKSRILLPLALVLGAAGIFYFVGNRPSVDLALAEFRVANLTCGSCVENVSNALTGVAGVAEVTVNVTSGRARVSFDPNKVADADIAGRITAAGYPAETVYTLDPKAYRILKTDEAALADSFVGRIGERLIPRTDFEEDLRRRRISLGGKPVSEGVLSLEVWEATLQRALLLGAAEQNKVVVQDAEVEREFERMGSKSEGFAALVTSRFGGAEAFKRTLKEDLVIRRNLDEHVSAGIADPALRQARLNAWYGELLGKTPVVIFDPVLKTAVEGGGKGCGGSCCG
jgi:copper chaperone CopZ